MARSRRERSPRHADDRSERERKQEPVENGPPSNPRLKVHVLAHSFLPMGTLHDALPNERKRPRNRILKGTSTGF